MYTRRDEIVSSPMKKEKSSLIRSVWSDFLSVKMALNWLPRFVLGCHNDDDDDDDDDVNALWPPKSSKDLSLSFSFNFYWTNSTWFLGTTYWTCFDRK